MGCGDLVLELRRRLVSMLPGEVLRVTALDPGAPLDIPAWCSLTGHRLRASVHPDYWIQRRSG
ncbi:MAG: sulfurtransferase TusA family protein [Planctomycetes bacterium]|nr:sulfurtransferase TusA family protein [Planctomycetota bacterium]MCB9872469.1 sulfurtransferase TusA family protein [Planctomycetota bacterium]MCB9889832.1 sulfurtransferase TusA family protein [Planctomycetota bacterium]